MQMPRAALKDAGVGFLVQKEVQQGGFEFPSRRFFDLHLEPGDLFVDIGAHWGIFTLQAATRHPGAVKVLAIEPHPVNVEQLRHAVTLNGLGSDVEVVAAAAGATSGTAPLVINSTMGHSLYGHGLPAGSADATRLTVPVQPLDLLLLERPDLQKRRTFLKVDVEGFEPEVMAGARELLKSGRVAAVLWEKGRATAKPERREPFRTMIEGFQDLGFSLFRFPHPEMGGPLVPFAPTPEGTNVFALAPGFEPRPFYDKPRQGPEPLPVPNRAPADPESRAAATEILKTWRSTDAARWADFDALAEGAAARADLAAAYVTPGHHVLDLGAGTMALRNALPPECRYQPADLLPYAKDTLVVDLNQGAFPAGSWDSIAALELLEYIHDVPALLRRCRQQAARLVLLYNLFEGEAPATRRGKGWFNDFSREELLTLLKDAGWRVSLEESLGSGAVFLYVCE